MTRILALHWFDNSAPWRVSLPIGALEQAGYEVKLAAMNGDFDLEQTDVLVMHCPGNRRSVELAEVAKSRGIRLVVDVDDLFVSARLGVRTSWIADEPDSIEHAQLVRERALGRFRRCLTLADLVTASTSSLALAYERFNNNIHVLPNCYDDRNALWSLARPQRDYVHIGFAGLGNTQGNLSVLEGVLEPVLGAHPEVRVVEAGGPTLLPMIGAPVEQLVPLGTLSFAMFPLLLHQMDIVLAPLTDTPFNRAKSNIRCMTAGLVGAPVVASPVGAYAEFVEHGVNGFLASSRHEWVDALERLIEDPALRGRLGAANRTRALTFGISQHWQRWARAYHGLLDRRRCA